MKADTPRTDAETRFSWVGDEPCVLAEFARALERELGETNRLYHLASALANAGDELREQIKAELHDEKLNVEGIVDELRTVKEERDRLKAELKMMRTI